MVRVSQPSLFSLAESPVLNAEGLEAAIRQLQDEIFHSTLAASEGDARKIITIAESMPALFGQYNLVMRPISSGQVWVEAIVKENDNEM